MPFFKAVSLPFLIRDMLAFGEAATFDLEVSTGSDSAINLEITGVTREGPFRFNFTTDGLSVIETHVFSIPDIPVFLTVRTADANLRMNDCYAMVYLRVNKTKNHLLCQGNLGQFYGINWPNQAPMSELQRRGKVTVATGADPAAGSEWTVTVPAGQFWRVKSVQATLVASATAATRRPMMIITFNGGGDINIPINTGTTANQTMIHTWAEGIFSINDTGNLLITGVYPADLLLPPFSTIRSLTANLQVGDNWSAPVLLVEIYFSDMAEV